MRDKKGFLLFEVIISIAIIGSGLLFVMRAYSSSKQVLDKARELLNASLLLEEKMFELEEKGEIEETLKDGTFGNDRGCSWALEAKPIEGSNLNIVTLNVFKKEDANPTRYPLVTYLKNKPQ